MNPHKQNWFEENERLYPLKEGDRLECVEARAHDVSRWVVGHIYTANIDGAILDGIGFDWFGGMRRNAFPSSALFRRIDDTPKPATLTINITDENGNPVSADLLRKLADMLGRENDET